MWRTKSKPASASEERQIVPPSLDPEDLKAIEIDDVSISVVEATNSSKYGLMFEFVITVDWHRTPSEPLKSPPVTRVADDVAALRENLNQNFEGIVIPPAPTYSSFMKEFYTTTQATFALERDLRHFLTACINHDDLRLADALKAFLLSPSSEWKANWLNQAPLAPLTSQVRRASIAVGGTLVAISGALGAAAEEEEEVSVEEAQARAHRASLEDISQNLDAVMKALYPLVQAGQLSTTELQLAEKDFTGATVTLTRDTDRKQEVRAFAAIGNLGAEAGGLQEKLSTLSSSLREQKHAAVLATFQEAQKLMSWAAAGLEALAARDGAIKRHADVEANLASVKDSASKRNEMESQAETAETQANSSSPAESLMYTSMVYYYGLTAAAQSNATDVGPATEALEQATRDMDAVSERALREVDTMIQALKKASNALVKRWLESELKRQKSATTMLTEVLSSSQLASTSEQNTSIPTELITIMATTCDECYEGPHLPFEL